MLSRFAACDQLMATWYETTESSSRKHALARQIDVASSACLFGLLNRGRGEREDAGVVVGFWNGRDAEGKATMNVMCGAHSQWLGNAVGVDLPQSLCHPLHVATPALLLAAAAEAWEPDRAVVASRGAMKARKFSAKVPFVDWMLYLSDKLYPRITSMPTPASAHRVAEIGSIIVVQPEPPDPGNAEHLRNIERVERVLADAGIVLQSSES
jgi:hypothetical protein